MDYPISRIDPTAIPQDSENLGDAKFVMLWQNKDGVWKVTRVISYDHNHGLLAK
ncbi:MAG: hypothetical protein WB683_08925 [Candidatus Sulfotelmatobacter sp.]